MSEHSTPPVRRRRGPVTEMPVGATYGRLTLLGYAGRGKDDFTWRCRCECGNEIVTGGKALRSGNTQSCGCKRVKPNSIQVQRLREVNEARRIAMVGRRFGRWTVQQAAERRPGRNGVYWVCRCDCGTVREVNGTALRDKAFNGSKSCGCLRSEMTARRSTKHGHTKSGLRSRTYNAYSQMLSRCTNKKRREYARYGARGITVCERWQGEGGFANFLADMGDMPPRMSLDRIDNDGNYEPGNCRWATSVQQNRNRRSNHVVEYRGERLCLKEWAERLGWPYHVLVTRINVLEWPPEKAIETPWPCRRSNGA